jgi:hypothetical protein
MSFRVLASAVVIAIRVTAGRQTTERRVES